MTLVFLLEERSTKRLLDILLPQIVPHEISYYTIAHDGKSDLQKSIKNKLTGWNTPDTKFIIVQDQDSSDCVELKSRLKSMCADRSNDVLIRIACHEMEAWYFGDLKAVSTAYGKDLMKYSRKSKYRIPDNIENPKNELKMLIPEHEQISGADRIGRCMDINNNSSQSFNALVSGIKNMIRVYRNC